MQLGPPLSEQQLRLSNSIPKYMAWRQNQVFDSIALFGQGGPGNESGRWRPPPTSQIPARFRRLLQSLWRFHADRPHLHTGRGRPRRTERRSSELLTLAESPRRQTLRSSALPSRSTERRTPCSACSPAASNPILRPTFSCPFKADPNSTNQGHFLRVAGRLKAGRQPGGRSRANESRRRTLPRPVPKFMDKNESVAVVPCVKPRVGDVKPALFILLGAVAFVLVNRVRQRRQSPARARRREASASSPSGSRLARIAGASSVNCLPKSLLLAGIGGILGFALGSWGVRGLLLLAPATFPASPTPMASRPSFRRSIGPSRPSPSGSHFVTAIVFGLYPAVHTSNPDLRLHTQRHQRTLRHRPPAAPRALHPRGLRKLRLALVLLIGAGPCSSVPSSACRTSTPASTRTTSSR